MNIPNCISLFRLLLIPVFIWCLQKGMFLPAAALIAFSALSDLFDGYLARKFNQVTKVGTLLDPLADKLFVMAGFVYFLYVGQISMWFVCAVFYRDMCLLVGVIALWLSNRNAIVPSLTIGKISSALSVTFVFFLCINQKYPAFTPLVAFFYGATFISVVGSFLFYSQRWFWLYNDRADL